MTKEPVIWQADPRHRAERIRCAVCTSCEWHPSGCCSYGGPFYGYEEKKPTISEKKVQNEITPNPAPNTVAGDS